mmetsp:Transcript_8162/g.27401  ORF Transcript_8162/g.27401 Transcript_8162/m.27401 type:complete len:101 (-) Transcript_8162:563-865(-)
MKNSPLDRDAKYTIALIANRHAIDPKRHYRKEERKPQNTPKLFQVGTVMSTSAEFYSSRLKRKEQRCPAAACAAALPPPSIFSLPVFRHRRATQPLPGPI